VGEAKVGGGSTAAPSESIFKCLKPTAGPPASEAVQKVRGHNTAHFAKRAANQTMSRGSNALDHSSGMDMSRADDYKGHGAEHFVQRAANQSVARGSNALDQSSRMVFSQTAGDYKGHAPEHYASPVRVANQSLSRGTEALANDGSMHLTRSSDDYKAFH
jgi:hypothetical protein